MEKTNSHMRRKYMNRKWVRFMSYFVCIVQQTRCSNHFLWLGSAWFLYLHFLHFICCQYIRYCLNLSVQFFQPQWMQYLFGLGLASIIMHCFFYCNLRIPQILHMLQQKECDFPVLIKCKSKRKRNIEIHTK